MGAGATPSQISRGIFKAVNFWHHKGFNVTYRVLRASNGETALFPESVEHMATGEQCFPHSYGEFQLFTEKFKQIGGESNG
jgi:hypothetical protein